MADKKRKSELPAGSLSNGEFGSNYGLDGFDFDTNYNEGVLDRARLPEAMGIAQLPDGIVTGPRTADGWDTEDILQEDKLGDLGSFMKEASNVSNLSWLQDVVQDLDRLPKSPRDRVIRELEEAWGLNRRTDGVHLIPNTQKENIAPERRKLASSDLLRIMQKAIRRAHTQEPLPAILQDIVLEAGQDLKRIKSAIQMFSEDHALLGRIYVQANVFPKCHNGTLSEKVRKHPGQYVLKKEACSDCRFVQEGRCSVFKKALVEDIPWQEALDHYGPQLRAEGRKVASNLAPRTALLNALRQPLPKRKADRQHTIEKKVVDQVSLKEARSIFSQAAPATQAAIPTAQERFTQEQRQRVAHKISGWEKAGLLDRKATKQLLADPDSPKRVLEKAAQQITQRKQAGTYTGIGLGHDLVSEVSADFAWQFLRAAGDKVAQEQAQLDQRDQRRLQASLERLVKAHLISPSEQTRLLTAGSYREAMDRVAVLVAEASTRLYDEFGQQIIRDEVALKEAMDQLTTTNSTHPENQKLAHEKRQRVLRKVEAMCKVGLITKKEAQILSSLKKSSQEIAQITQALLAKKAASKAEVPLLATKVQTYAGQGEGKASISMQMRSASVSKETAQNKTIRRVVKYATEKMNEGFAGPDLDDLITARFSNDTLDKAADQLRQARASHEGLAGHLYINVGGYASEKGTAGCEEGALRHRGNGIKFALAMKRCGSCVFHNAEGVCQKYNKILTDTAPTADPVSYQQEVLRLAQATDAEMTQNLFTPASGNVVAEFGLGGLSDLEDFEIKDAPTNDRLAGILLGGGWDLPED